MRDVTEMPQPNNILKEGGLGDLIDRMRGKPSVAERLQDATGRVAGSALGGGVTGALATSGILAAATLLDPEETPRTVAYPWFCSERRNRSLQSAARNKVGESHAPGREAVSAGEPCDAES